MTEGAPPSQPELRRRLLDTAEELAEALGISADALVRYIFVMDCGEHDLADMIAYQLMADKEPAPEMGQLLEPQPEPQSES
eukprot:COSAG04_NODE_1057_length_8525_cov_2.545336_3_plen_81_part_00